MYEIYERLLAAFGVTTADVCRATGLKESSISNWKRRGGHCGAKTAELLCGYFGVSMDYLMTGKDCETPHPPHNQSLAQAGTFMALTGDKPMITALDTYLLLTDEQKKHVIDTIYLLGKQ